MREPFMLLESPESTVTPIAVLPNTPPGGALGVAVAISVGVSVGVALGTAAGLEVAVGEAVAGLAVCPIRRLSKLVSHPLLELTLTEVQLLTHAVVSVTGVARAATVALTTGLPVQLRTTLESTSPPL
jgi:hypothetical protein